MAKRRFQGVHRSRDKIADPSCWRPAMPKRSDIPYARGLRHMHAGLLLIAVVGFLSPADQRIRDTVAGHCHVNLTRERREGEGRRTGPASLYFRRTFPSARH